MRNLDDIIEEINSIGKDWPDEKKCRIIYREVMNRAKYNPLYQYIDNRDDKYKIYSERNIKSKFGRYICDL